MLYAGIAMGLHAAFIVFHHHRTKGIFNQTALQWSCSTQCFTIGWLLNFSWMCYSFCYFTFARYIYVGLKRGREGSVLSTQLHAARIFAAIISFMPIKTQSATELSAYGSDAFCWSLISRNRYELVTVYSIVAIGTILPLLGAHYTYLFSR